MEMKKRWFSRFCLALIFMFAMFTMIPVSNVTTVKAQTTSYLTDNDSSTESNDPFPTGIEVDDDGTVHIETKGSKEQAVGGIYGNLKFVLGVVLVVCFIAVAIYLAICIAKLAASGDNPTGRRTAIISIIVCLISLGLLGSFGTWIAIAMGLFK